MLTSFTPTTPKERLLLRWYPEVGIQGYTNVDSTVAFYSRIASLCPTAQRVVDFGCGRGRHSDDALPFRRALTNLRRDGRQVIGLDIDPVGNDNPLIDEFRKIVPGREWPIESNSVDLIVSDWVVEHLSAPLHAFQQAARVLKPGAYFCLRTQNLLGYTGALTRMIPNGLHEEVLMRVQRDERHAHDVFPTYHRANTRRQLTRLMIEAGLQPTVVCHEPEPAYLGFNPAAYCLGVLYQRFAPECIRTVLLGFGRKPSLPQ